ncbi:MAG: hypothetical protein AAFV77_10835, partial [Planctomycetota bacterium]
SGGPAADTRLRELIEILIADPKNGEAEREFWREFCALDKWHFLALADEAKKAIGGNQGGVRLQVYRDGDRALVPVYTSAELATEALGEQDTAAISMPPEAAVGYVCGLRNQINGIMVNVVPGKASGFGFRLPELCALFHRECGTLPPSAIHSTVDYARNTQHPDAFRMVHDVVAGCEKLYVAIKDQSFAFVKDEEKLWLWAFSDEAIATRACEQHPGLQLVETTPAQLVQRVEQAVVESEGRIKGAVLNHPENTVMLDHELLRGSLNAVAENQQDA